MTPDDAITPERVCKILEGLCMVDFHETNPQEFADMVYEFCHIARAPECLSVHADWCKKFLETEKEILCALESPNDRAKRLSTNT